MIWIKTKNINVCSFQVITIQTILDYLFQYNKKKYNLNSFFNDTNNNLYYRKKLFKDIIWMMKKYL